MWPLCQCEDHLDTITREKEKYILQLNALAETKKRVVPTPYVWWDFTFFFFPFCGIWLCFIPPPISMTLFTVTDTTLHHMSASVWWDFVYLSSFHQVCTAVLLCPQCLRQCSRPSLLLVFLDKLDLLNCRSDTESGAIWYQIKCGRVGACNNRWKDRMGEAAAAAERAELQ